MVSTATSHLSQSGPFDSGSLTEAEPMPQSPLHMLLLVLLVDNLQAALAERGVAALVLSDVFWVDARDERQLAPDIGIAFGVTRPRRRRFFTEDDGVGFDFVIEIVSPSDANPLDPGHVRSLAARYERRGVLEYVEFHSARNLLRIFDRRSGAWAEVADPWSWTSELTGLRVLDVEQAGDLGWLPTFGGPAGPYRTFVDLAAERGAAQAERDRLAEKLRALGVDPDA